MRPLDNTQETFWQAVEIYKLHIPPHLRPMVTSYFENLVTEEKLVGDHAFVKHIHKSGSIVALEKELLKVPQLGQTRIHALQVVCPWAWVDNLQAAMQDPDKLLSKRLCVYVKAGAPHSPNVIKHTPSIHGFTKQNTKPTFSKNSLQSLRAWAKPWCGKDSLLVDFDRGKNILPTKESNNS